MSGPVTFQPGAPVVKTTDGTEESPRIVQTDVIPDTDSGGMKAAAATDLPILPAPKLGGLSLESLIQALGMEERTTAVKNGVADIKAKAAEREKATEERIEAIKKKIETMESQKTAKSVFKVFKWIGAILGAVAAVATTVVGVATANPALIIGGALLMVSAASAITSLATDGEKSLATGIAKLAQKLGASEKVAQIIGIATEISVTVVGCILSFSGAAGLAAKGAEVAAKAPGALLNVVDGAGKTAQFVGAGYAFTTGKFVAAIVPQVAAVIGGVTAAVSAAGEGVNAYYDYKITNTQADQKKLAAILERIQQAIDMNTDFVEALMERNNELSEQVNDIVKENAQAQTAILSGSAPAMA